MTTINLPDFSTQREQQKRNQKQFEMANSSWVRMLRDRAKKTVSGADFDIAPYIKGESLDYYNECITQLLMYRN